MNESEIIKSLTITFLPLYRDPCLRGTVQYHAEVKIFEIGVSFLLPHRRAQYDIQLVTHIYMM